MQFHFHLFNNKKFRLFNLLADDFLMSVLRRPYFWQFEATGESRKLNFNPIGTGFFSSKSLFIFEKIIFLSEDSLQHPRAAQALRLVKKNAMPVARSIAVSLFYTTSSKLGNLSFSSLWSDLVNIIIPSIINVVIILGSEKMLWKTADADVIILLLYLKENTR